MPPIRLNKRMKPLNLLESMNPQLPNRNCLITLMFKTGLKKAAFLLGLILIVNLFNVKEAAGQVAKRGSATTASAATANNTTITINKPTGVVAGDVLLFSVVQNETDNDNGGLASPTLSGWTLVKDVSIRSEGTNNGDNAWFGSIYYRVSDGSEGASFSFAMNSRCDMAIGSMVAFTGVACNALKPDGSANGPFDIVPGTFNNANSATATATAVTVANSNSALIMFAMCMNDRSYSSWSNSQTQLFSDITTNGDDASVGAAWLSSVNSGSTGTRTVTLSASDRNSAILLVLRRATNMTVGAASSSPTLCVNSALTNITHTTTGATGIGTATGLPAGVTAAWASNTITISGTPTASGSFTYSIPLTGGCGSVNATGTITVTPTNTVGSASSTPTVCINTALTNITHTTTGATGIANAGTAGANGLPPGVAASLNSGTITIFGTPSVAGSYSYSILLLGGCGSVNATGTITVNANVAISSQSTATQTKCITAAFTPITVTATGVGLTYQWYSNTANSNTGGTSLVAANGAQTNSYTPQSTVAGTLYYYCIVSGTCGTAVTSTVSGAFITNANVAISSQSTATQTKCITAAFTPITVTATGVGLTYQWYSNAANSNSGGTSLVAANGAQPNSYTPQSTVAGTLYYYCIVSGTCGTAVTSTVSGAFITNANVAISSQSTATQTKCITAAFTPITVTATGVGLTYQWYSNAANSNTGGTSLAAANGAQTNSYTPQSTVAGTLYYYCIVSGTCGTAITSTVSGAFITNSNLTASVSIAASATTICAGASVTFTATPTNGGTTPAYQWKLNGVNAGTNSATFTTTTLANTDAVTVVLTSNATPCLTGSPVTSNTVTMTVTPTNTVGVASSTPTVCINTALTSITHTTTGATGIANAGTAGANGLPAGVAASWNSNTITIFGTPSVSGTFGYSIPLTGGCGSVNATGTITVNPNLPASVSIAASATTICSGTSVTFTATPTNGGTTPAYQWKLNGSNVGTNSATYTTTGLTNGQAVTVVMTSNATPCLTGSPATSNEVTMTVNSNLPASVSIAASAITICSGTSVTFTATPTNGGTTPAYQWKLNGTNINGATSATYTTTGLTNGQVVTVVMTSNATPCLTGSPATSNAVTMTVNTTAAPTASAQSFCVYAAGQTFANLTATGTAIKWYNSLTYGSAIPTTTSLYAGTFYVSQTVNGCESERASVVVTGLTPAVPTTSNQTFCNGATVAQLVANGTAIQWYADNSGGVALTSTTLLISGRNYYASQTLNGCESYRAAAWVTVTTTAAPTAAAQSFCNGATVASIAATGSAIKWYQASSGGAALATSTVLSNGTYYATQTLNGCESNTRTAVSVTVASSLTWLGNTTDWNSASNWCGGVPTASTDVVISAGVNQPVISGTAFCKNLTINNGASVSIVDANTLTVSGNWSNAGTFSGGTVIFNAISSITGATTFKNLTLSGAAITANNDLEITGDFALNSGSLDMSVNTLKVGGNFSRIAGNIDVSKSTLEMNGAKFQTLNGAFFVGKSIANLVNNNIEGITLTGDTVRILQLLSFANANADLNVNDGKLTIVSNAIATGSVGELAAGNVITGNVTVERYISQNRRWRYLSAPTSGQSFKQAWQEGSASANTNPTPGYGFVLGYPSGNYAGLGFDLYAPGGHTVKTYNPVSNGWDGISSTSELLSGQKGYMSFVIGDRSGSAGTSTVARTTGSLYQGTQPTINIPANTFAGIGNPYASPVQLAKITRSNSIQDVFYVWDPKLTTQGVSAYGLGGYQTITRQPGYTKFEVYPGGGSYGEQLSEVTSLQSGLAFFVRAEGQAGTLTFEESAKGTGSAQVFFTAGLPTRLRANLAVVQPTGPTVVDGVMVRYNDQYNNTVGGEDILKIGNTNENVSIQAAGKTLVIDNRNQAMNNDTIHLKMSGVRVQTYQWQLVLDNMDTPGLTAFLIDRYLNTTTTLNMAGTTTVNFGITNIAGSYAVDRFKIVFNQSVVLPVTITSVSANRNTDKTVGVQWKVANELNLEGYQVERSLDGRNFAAIAAKAPQNNTGGRTEYSITDADGKAGDLFYRIKANSTSGQVQYSAIVKVAALKNSSNQAISVYPNPVVNKNMHVQFLNQPAGTYGVKLMSTNGAAVYQNSVEISGSNQVKMMQLSNKIAAGNYKLQVISADGSQLTLPVLVL